MDCREKEEKEGGAGQTVSLSRHTIFFLCHSSLLSRDLGQARKSVGGVVLGRSACWRPAWASGA